MSFEPVDIQFLDRFGNGIEGVLVKIYDPTGTTFYTQATADVTGSASLLLETQPYSMRFYKYQTGFSQPQRFEVLAAPEVNIFLIQGEPFVLPTATDPRLCRCSGFFRDLNGGPKRYLDIHIIGKFDPIVLDDAGVISDQVDFRTDLKGFASIDLIRGAQYEAYVEAIGGAATRCISIPDAASCNLPDLLLPIVKEVVLSPLSPYTLAIGEELTITPRVYDSAGVLLDGAAVDDIDWRSSDSNILRVSPLSTTIVLRGNAVGSAQLTATRRDKSIIKIPDLSIVGQPASIVVNP